MAYMSQERKKELKPNIKAVLAKYGMKGTVSVRDYSTLICTISSGKLDLLANAREKAKREGRTNQYEGYYSVNHYYIDSTFDGEVAQLLNELRAAMMIGNRDNSDTMTDYHDIGWYVKIEIGKWNKPYIIK
jgi:hypothetical protein